MMVDPAQSDIIDALLAQVQFDGWTDKSVRQALAASGGQPDDSRLLFPGGAGDMIAVFCAVADARMAAAADAGLEAFRIPGRVRAIIAIRLEQNRGHKEAIRRALSWLSIPANAPLAARLTAATVDEIWHAAGDAAADFSWYSKRGTLTAVYGATLLYWLRDMSGEDEETLAFLERRLAGVGRIGAARKAVAARAGRLREKVKGFATGRA